MAPAQTPDPPYWAVIFTTERSDDLHGYAEMSRTMVDLAGRQPGFLGMESAYDGTGITVSYWADEASITAWRDQVDHATARKTGRARWYDRYEVRVARVERAYSWQR
ncbi:MAG: antibiotic biosynthesis monooxygenase family protein [Microthrixaceae bacterium]